ncbi:hypothetical protein ACXR0O_25380 [Verrucomicrobiota bacterium sgz303538]
MFVRLLLCALALVISGCIQGPPIIESPREIAGEYAFRFKDGKVEVFTLGKDYTYRQELFSDIASYQNDGVPERSAEGTWSFEGNEITFMHCWDFTDRRDATVTAKVPERLRSGTGGWFPNWAGIEADGVIVISERDRYILARLTDRKTLK